MVKQKDLWRNIIHNLGNIFFFPLSEMTCERQCHCRENPQNLYHCIHCFIKAARSDPKNQQYNYFNFTSTACFLSAACLVSGMIFVFFSTCRGAGFLSSSCIYSTEERKTDPWSSYLHNAQKHLSQDSCWWIEASGDTAVDHLPLIIFNSFSVNRSSEWGCLRR